MYTNFKTNAYSSLLALLLLLALYAPLTGCTDDDDDVNVTDPVVVADPLSPAPNVTTTISGQVLDEDGNPLAGATVMAHGETATTDAAGAFRLQHIRVPGNRYVISCEKQGYFTSVRADTPLKDKVTSVRIRLMSNAPTHTIDAGSGGTATLANGSKVEIPANGLVTASGEVYEGEVNMSVRYQDPSAVSFGAFVAGGDMLARRTDQSSTILYSYGILRVQLTGSGGEKLQLAAGKPSTLTVAIPESQLATAPPTIPLWYFDEEEGVWQEEGAATRQGNQYIGTVKHFTDWNCDDPNEFATIIGKVVDCDGSPILVGDIFVGQSTSDLSNGYEIDNAAGNGGKQTGFRIRVPAGMPLMVVVPPPITVALLSPPTDWVLVPVPPLAPGQVYDAGTIKPHPCPSTTKGKFKTREGDQVTYLSMKVLNSGSNTNLIRYPFEVPVANAAFSANFLAANTSYSMLMITESGLQLTKEFTTTAAGETVDLGTIDLTGLQQIPVAGLVLCQNTPIENAAVSVVWAGGSVNTTTDNLGLYEFSMPVGTPGVVSVTHSRGTGTMEFVTPASNGYRINTIDICKHNTETGENSFVINGDGYNNVKKSLNLSPYPGSFAYYHRDEALSQLVMADVSDNLNVNLIFPGNTTGTVEDSERAGARILIKTGSKTITYWAGFEMEGSSLVMNITHYSAVEGLIEGTFSGTFIGDNGSTVTITGGKFSVIRFHDFSGPECSGFCM